MRTCIFCQKEIHKRKDAIFCSKQCKKNSYYWRNRDKILKKRAESKPKNYCQICKQIQIKRGYKYCSQCLYIKEKEWKQKEYRNHILKYREHSRINQKKYIYSTPERMTRCLLRNRFRDAMYRYTFYGKIKPSIEYGILYKKIIEKLECDLGRKLTWEDLKNNQLHHKKELITFDLSNPEEIKKAFAPDNIILITIHEHRKITQEFLAKRRIEKVKQCTHPNLNT